VSLRGTVLAVDRRILQSINIKFNRIAFAKFKRRNPSSCAINKKPPERVVFDVYLRGVV
jgi:hypothetical protein